MAGHFLLLGSIVIIAFSHNGFADPLSWLFILVWAIPIALSAYLEYSQQRPLPTRSEIVLASLWKWLRWSITFLVSILSVCVSISIIQSDHMGIKNILIFFAFIIAFNLFIIRIGVYGLAFKNESLSDARARHEQLKKRYDWRW